MNNIIISALIGILLGLLISRKRGPFGIFRFIKETKGLNIIFRCETCTTLWITFVVFLLRAYLGIIPNSELYYDLFFGMLASGGLALVFGGLAGSMVDHDS